MARKRYSDEQVLKLLCEVDFHVHDGLDVVSACRKAQISDKSYYFWRKKFDFALSGMLPIENSYARMPETTGLGMELDWDLIVNCTMAEV